MSKDSDNKRANAELALKAGAVFVGLVIIKRGIRKIFNPYPGRVDRVPFIYSNTQVRKYPVGNGEFYTVADPWQPGDFARRLYEVMRGWDGDNNVFKQYLLEYNQLGQDRARWLHNYWLDNIDQKDTLYRWINDEATTGLVDWNWLIYDWDIDGSRAEAKENALKNMRNWGVGF